ncbi:MULTISPECIES: ABC transporter substrate-binding protein [Microbacterium]|uniref:ABC transporter substrate-binding protein n=1 Tax=Microbacterium TaxID=33882 RepID=UPI002788B96B|nr:MULTISPECIES: ABC transporter substrate-binding protein [Microbacterium]MDQ1082145.1 raffinose/stachyose/melibiose transport system substrate-binding protein [Microbacterium sp. SORGH_AS_0344]MDQ1169083.1 raffinose/stachyose/melibiose transport system substrate-binding protein [Microbacterium proteolyticum]
MAPQRRFTRIAGLLVLPATASLVLAGCSGSGSGDASQGGSNSFSLTYATSNNIESPFEALAKKYMEANPDVTITLNPQPNDTYGDTLRTQLQAGNASDVLETEAGSGQTRSIIPLARANFLEPLPESVKDVIPAGSENLVTLDGTIYGQPLGISYAGLIYNEVAATAAGITSFATTENELITQCQEASAAGKSLFVLAGATVPNAGITASIVAATRVYAETPDWNQQRLDGEVTFADSAGWKDTLETVKKLYDEGCFQAGAEGAGFDAITNGLTSGTNISFFGPVSNAAQLQSAAPEQKFVAQAFPPATAGDKSFGVASPTYSLSLNAASANKDAANAFLDWVAAPEQANLFADVSGLLPVSGLSSLDLSSTIYADVADQIENGDYTPLANSDWPNASVYDALATGVQGLLTGQSTVESVLASLDTAWDQ